MSAEDSEAPSLNEMRAFAYRLLGRREYSIFELRQRIQRKWPESGDVDDLVGALVDENLVSDERYTESFVRFRAQRFQGPLKIRADLRGKGVSDHLIERELGAAAEDWSGLAAQWLHRQVSGTLDFDQKKKYYRRLTSRGFTHGQAMDAVNRTHSSLD
ncbi:MAG: regulatory protein RecX [Xanthomonadales bacterium]|nr:recombination regulator RecX [Gammaproteobacteria bacterium]MBT8054143.1 recombination regulator RecX [Gammaproteobacteria bacterium]NND58577.1 regulatory protein RecX [Xanthomonadales bacterium]NNK52193.1 regulatory protein RecX [Xanthomonadales bacterium]NNL95647.1 regulatory protein RecX [Xanthomonadales bacterium]